MSELKISREKLEAILKECWGEGSPYTGEYWMGKADLANELLGNPELDWDKAPRFKKLKVPLTKKEEK